MKNTTTSNSIDELPLVIIRSLHDVREWVRNTRGDCDDDVVGAVVDRIGYSAHPAWGGDWAGWLSAEMPLVIEEVADELDGG